MKILNYFFATLLFLSLASLAFADTCIVSQDTTAVCWNSDLVLPDDVSTAYPQFGQLICNLINDSSTYTSVYTSSVSCDENSDDYCVYEVNCDTEEEEQIEEVIRTRSSRGGGSVVSCTTREDCGNFSECVNGLRVASCYVVRTCGTTETILSEYEDSEACIVETTTGGTVGEGETSGEGEAGVDVATTTNNGETDAEGNVITGDATNNDLLTGEAVTDTNFLGNAKPFLFPGIALLGAGAIVLGIYIRKYRKFNRKYI